MPQPTAFDRVLPLPSGEAPPSDRNRRAIAFPPLGEGPPALHAGLASLARLRTVATIGQATAIAIALAASVALPVVPMLAIVVALTMLTWHARRRVARAHVSQRETYLHVLADLFAFTALLALSGGATNPFVLLYLLHAVVIVLILPPRQAGAGIGLLLACSALVASTTAPLMLTDGTRLPGGLLAFAWALSFASTVTISAWFVSRVVAALRDHDRELAEARRAAANDEAVLRVGALAAGAAHELASPLSTMAVVVGEMQRAAATDDERRDASILAAQIGACRETLSHLLAAAGHTRVEGGSAVALDAFVGALVERFRAVRPGVALACRVHGDGPAPRIFADASLQQSLLNLMNNAADASPQAVSLAASWDATTFSFIVDDCGDGIPPSALARLGREFFTTKAPGKGTGLGLMLTAKVVGRLGGTVRWSNRSEGGARAEVALPLRALTLPEKET